MVDKGTASDWLGSDVVCLIEGKGGTADGVGVLAMSSERSAGCDSVFVEIARIEGEKYFARCLDCSIWPAAGRIISTQKGVRARKGKTEK